MAKVAFKGSPVPTVGDLPGKGTKAPDFSLVDTELADVSLSDYEGQKVVLNIFPSIDTPVCAASVKRFNDEASSFDNTQVLCISVDLPFAHGRFCGAEGLSNVKTLSAFRDHNFGSDYGVRITDGALAGLFARAVVVIGEDGAILHSQLVPEITDEPDYSSALAVLK
jgi:thiol peroxidase